ELERTLQAIASKSHDYHEGVKAFQEKRKPKFSGR
ncbi:MAG TPA: 2-(1,2-epoxy-1,2-dihydrophenyl)acetyl-CoA isomerase, partial [Myxococcota bacterium]|nr:2-(1,2-epoxy-1,2-dihydrophenyl)acetyl-CoA isomerase [Myxococcota bacterium]